MGHYIVVVDDDDAAAAVSLLSGEALRRKSGLELSWLEFAACLPKVADRRVPYQDDSAVGVEVPKTDAELRCVPDAAEENSLQTPEVFEPQKFQRAGTFDAVVGAVLDTAAVPRA